MRSVTIVKDAKGVVKVGQFGNYIQIDWLDEPDKTDNELLEEYRQYIIEFFRDEKKVKKLQENIAHLSFYTSKDMSDFNAMYNSNRKADVEYCNTWLDMYTGIRILDTIVSHSTSKVKLEDYSTKAIDPMFAEVIFDIDFQKKYVEMRYHGRPYERIDLRSHTTLTTETKVIEEVKKDAIKSNERRVVEGDKIPVEGRRVSLW